MTLQEQCVSLELAKKMKELGFKQESLFYWGRDIYCDHFSKISTQEDSDFNIECSAYTVAELGAMFIEFYTIKWQRGQGNLISAVNEETGQTYYVRDVDTEVNGRAEILISLKLINLI